MKKSIILWFFCKIFSLSIYFVAGETNYTGSNFVGSVPRDNETYGNSLKKADNTETASGHASGINITSRGYLSHRELEPLGSFFGGRYPLYAEYPFLVNIVIRESGTSHCAGTIISEYFIITSCHCTCYDNGRGEIVAEKPDKFLVFAGAQAAWGIGTQSNLSQVRRVSKVVKYFYCSRDKDTLAWDHDVSVLTLTKRLIFNKFVKPVNVKSKSSKEIERLFENALAISKTCTVLGWGASKGYTGVLQAIDLYPISSFLCQSSIKDKSYTHIFERYRICFRPFDMLSTALCVANTGGPLICDNNFWGVLNWAPNCSKTAIPIVFTKLETFLDLYAPLSSATCDKIARFILFLFPLFQTLVFLHY
ncbi:serine protease VLSP-1 [Cimex lectularius]|uniref:Peptidase S1 domain-containing protein n=1 Tax=Cimex lectularius TaxID=79782 RepID=A0A8I6SAF8_CIMLE|nr:serine protease VLSP-1 [Cimex lectularius]